MDYNGLLHRWHKEITEREAVKKVFEVRASLQKK